MSLRTLAVACWDMHLSIFGFLPSICFSSTIRFSSRLQFVLAILPLFVLVLAPTFASGQQVSFGDGQGHTFSFTADIDAPVATDGRLPGLRQAALAWCHDERNSVTVGLEQCMSFLVVKTNQAVSAARARGQGGGGGEAGTVTPDVGLSPNLLQQQTAVKSPYHEGAPLRVPAVARVQASVRLAWSPSIQYLPGFLDPATCAELIRLATPLLQPSQTPQSQANNKTAHRTSMTAMLGRAEELANPLLRQLVERIHNLLHLPPDHGEGLQLSRYGAGDHYRIHEDAFTQSPRAFTVLAYLAGASSGGGGDTIFPLVSADGGSLDPGPLGDPRAWTNQTLFDEYCDETSERGRGIMRFKPTQGDAFIFTPMTPWLQTHPRGMHGACPVVEGEKWVLQRWVRHVSDPAYPKAWSDAQTGPETYRKTTDVAVDAAAELHGEL